MKFYLTAVFLFVSYLTNAQFSDDFSDGDFDTAPEWIGEESKFEINEDAVLQLNAPTEADIAYLTVSSTLIDDVVWDFFLQLDFNPSSSNLARVYLVSDNTNLNSALNGYFVQIGNTDDEISLYQQTGLTVTKIIDGADDVVNTDVVKVRIQVTRDAVGNWELFRDTLGGHDFISEGTVFENTHLTTEYFGVYAKYTATRSDKFMFDDLGSPYVDGTAPLLNSIEVVANNQIDLFFNEAMNELSVENSLNYIIDGGIGNPTSAVLNVLDPAHVSLIFDAVFSNLETYNLTINDVADLAENSIVTTTIPFEYIEIDTGEAYDIIFTELFPDPMPTIGLPEVEFIELYNRSEKVIDLNGWILSDNLSNTSLSEYLLLPDQYVLICSTDDLALFDIENKLGLASFPNLNNLKDSLVLKNNEATVVDHLVYTVQWYQNEDKINGGWTLERKNIIDKCSNSENWSASIDMNGGTPGHINSVWTEEADITSPDLKNLLVINDSSFLLIFTELLDTFVSVDFSINPGDLALEWRYINSSIIELKTTMLAANQLYNLTITNANDCWGNDKLITSKIGLPSQPIANDLILNEVLFNPITGASDYIEIYNNSDKLIDLSEIFIGNWDEGIANAKQIVNQRTLFLPQNFIVVSEDTSSIVKNYSIYNSASFIQADLPSFPNDSGTVYLVYEDDLILDFLNYSEKMQFSLLDDFDGKSLERIIYDDSQNNRDNWHTASEFVDWGTPGYRNSQYQQTKELGDITIEPQLFSPDNDGYNDVLTIALNFIKADLIIDIEIYDNQGRRIKKLEDNFFMGYEALFTWDGINDEGFKAGIGTYIVYTTVRDQNGWRKVYKNAVVLGGHF